MLVKDMGLQCRNDTEFGIVEGAEQASDVCKLLSRSSRDNHVGVQK